MKNKSSVTHNSIKVLGKYINPPKPTTDNERKVIYKKSIINRCFTGLGLIRNLVFEELFKLIFFPKFSYLNNLHKIEMTTKI